MKFKANKFTINPDKPYAEDKLDRKREVDNLSVLLRNISTPIVLSINGSWGSGKTTFVELLEFSLRSDGCNTIYFNAWETDFATDPLLAFLGEMNTAITTLLAGDQEKSRAWEIAKNAGTHIAKRSIPVALKLATVGLIDTEKIVEEEAAKLAEELGKDLVEEYSRDKDKINRFKEGVTKVLERDDGKTTELYIFVDELDRCRPTYAIELLERIKHLLDIEGLVFILALDKQQLAHSVKAVYGSDFDATGYLRRFVDFDYSLRHAELDNFIDKQYATFNFQEFFDARSTHNVLRHDAKILKNVFKMLAKWKELSLRDVEQLFARVNLVILSTAENHYLYPSLLAFLIFTREHEPAYYREYIQESNTPDKMIDLLHSLLPEDERLESGECRLVEAFLIAAKASRSSNLASNIIDKHNKRLEDTATPKNLHDYSEHVMQLVQRPGDIGREVSLSSIVQRIELNAQFTFAD